MEINIPFSKALTQMPLYEKFMKKILSRKRRISEEGIVSLATTCSVVIQNSLPKKMQDLGCFTIPCKIGQANMGKTLCDSGANINLMPLPVAKSLILGDLTPTAMTLQMENITLANPEGILEDVLIKVGKFIFPVDFVVINVKEKSHTIVRKVFLSNKSSFDRCEERRICENLKTCKTIDYCRSTNGNPRIFSRSWMMTQFSPLSLSREI